MAFQGNLPKEIWIHFFHYLIQMVHLSSFLSTQTDHAALINCRTSSSWSEKNLVPNADGVKRHGCHATQISSTSALNHRKPPRPVGTAMMIRLGFCLLRDITAARMVEPVRGRRPPGSRKALNVERGRFPR